ncbi:hypothetical protein tb265_18800 [Gemmatimonadetes bacterium T265]|nr:hypothetical protein tb265_18800 [Gemmatimonadetes bacterium T265]
MTKLAPLALAAVGAALAAAPHTARAQFPSPVSNPFSFGVSGGLAVPVGRLGDNLNSGYSVGGLVDFHPAPGPLSIRLEVGYDRFDVKSSVLTDVENAFGANVSANTHFFRGTGDLVYRLPTTGGLRPYLLGGVGVYSIGGGTSYTDGGTTISQNDNSQTKFGVNGGAGIELPLSGITVFLEARAHGVQTDAAPVTYIPITVGIRF